jgi:hypothetical protein
MLLGHPLVTQGAVFVLDRLVRKLLTLYPGMTGTGFAGFRMQGTGNKQGDKEYARTQRA